MGGSVVSNLLENSIVAYFISQNLSRQELEVVMNIEVKFKNGGVEISVTYIPNGRHGWTTQTFHFSRATAYEIGQKLAVLFDEEERGTRRFGW